MRRMAVLLMAVATVGFPLVAFPQSLSEQQLEYLREQFLQNLSEAVPGIAIEENSLPPNRIQGTVPANKIVEADPVAGAAAASAQAAADAATAAANVASAAATAAASTAGSAGAGVTALDGRVSSLEADSVVWDAAAASWNASEAAQATYAGTLVFSMVGRTVTLYVASGVITNAVQEGP